MSGKKFLESQMNEWLFQLLTLILYKVHIQYTTNILACSRLSHGESAINQEDQGRLDREYQQHDCPEIEIKNNNKRNI